MSGGGTNGFICGGGGTPNGGTAVLEGGVRTLEDTMDSCERGRGYILGGESRRDSVKNKT